MFKERNAQPLLRLFWIMSYEAGENNSYLLSYSMETEAQIYFFYLLQL